MGHRVFVVFNPASGKGRGARLVEPVLRSLESSPGLGHAVTARPGDEARLVQEALGQGFRRIVAVGGDGTWSNVANALLRAGVPGVELGLVAGGTGCDLAKSLGVPARDVAASARVILAGHTRRIDVGKVEGKLFLNVVGFGFDIAVIEDSWRVRWLSGDLLYLYCALRQLYFFPGFPVELEVDGVPSGRMELLMLVIANAKVFGGGFQIAPQADLADGRLDGMAFRNMRLGRRLPLMLRLLKGTHQATPEVVTQVARSFRLKFEKPPAYETDGEWNRAESAELLVETMPSALDVLVPA